MESHLNQEFSPAPFLLKLLHSTLCIRVSKYFQSCVPKRKTSKHCVTWVLQETDAEIELGGQEAPWGDTVRDKGWGVGPGRAQPPGRSRSHEPKQSSNHVAPPRFQLASLVFESRLNVFIKKYINKKVLILY